MPIRKKSGNLSYELRIYLCVCVYILGDAEIPLAFQTITYMVRVQKKSGNLLKAPRTYIYIYIYIVASKTKGQNFKT